MTQNTIPHLGLRFFTLSRFWRRRIDRELAAAGLSDASWTPLIHLAETGDHITQSELADRVGLDGSSLVRIIDILEKRGLVARQVPEGDRRARHIVVTEAGRAEVAAIMARLAVIERELVAGMSSEEIDMLHDGLGHMLSAVKAMEVPCK